jgi:hypothetical protein
MMDYILRIVTQYICVSKDGKTCLYCQTGCSMPQAWNLGSHTHTYKTCKPNTMGLHTPVLYTNCIPCICITWPITHMATDPMSCTHPPIPVVLPMGDVRGTLYKALLTHLNIYEHVQTSTNTSKHLQTTSQTLKHLRTYWIRFESSSRTSSRLWNIVACFIPYLDIHASFLDAPHHPGDHLFTCILTL